MKPVVNYLENLTKSMSYAAIDVSKEIMPNVGDFLDSNSGFLKATYATLRNPKMALRKSVTAIQESKIYQAVEYGAKNAFEDLRTGNFYNKERDDRDSIKMAGMNADFDDMSAYGIDDDWESQLNEKPTKKNEVTAGDLQITEAIEKTSSANASATVNAVVASAEYNAKITKATAGNLYLQNERLFGGLHQDLTVVGKTMDSIQNITSTALQNMDKNQSDFFTSQTKLSQERNAMLKELLEMQRNVYKSAVDKEKEDRSKDKKKNNRWEDVQFGGMVDFEAYKEVVMNNINNQIAGLGIPTLGNENSNMLATFMTSPLKSITTGLIHGLIPAATKVAAKNLDESLSGIFGNIIAEFSRMRNSDNKIAQAIGNIFGVNTSVDKSITTNRYEKGPIPFDGITRKSIIEVIPGYLRRIEAFLSGSNERVYNYETGSWTTIENLKQELRAKDKQYMKNATRDFMKAMNNFDPITHSTDYNTMKEMKDAVEELQIYMYNHGQALNTKRTAEENGISMSNYPNLYKHYNAIKEFMIARQEGGKVITRNNNMKSVDMVTKEYITAANKIADTKSSQHRFFRSIEDDVTNPYRVIYEDSFTGNHLKSTTPYAKIGDKDTVIHEVRQNTDSSGSGYDNNFNYGHLLFVKDNLGNTLYDYLQNINNEAIWWRETAFSTIALRLNSINNNIGGPIRVVGINDNTPPVTPPPTGDNNTPPPSNNSSNTSNSNNNPPPPPNNAISTALMAESIEDIAEITSRNPNFYQDRADALKNGRRKRAETRIKEIEEQKKQKDIDKAIEFLNKRKGIDLQHVNDEEINLQQLPDLIKVLVELNADSEGRKYIAAHTQETNLNFFTENLNKLSVQDFPKTIEEVQKLLEDEEKKEEKELEKEEEKEKDDDEKEKTFMEKMGDRIKKGATVVGGFIGATGEVFENLANTATRGIYDMLFRHKIKLRKNEDEDDEDEIDYNDGKYHGENVRDSDLETNEDDKKTEFEGIMDLIGYKIRRTFKGVRGYIKNSVINPIKKWLGKELDEDEDNPLKAFKDTLLDYGKNFINTFIDANSDIWGKAGEKIANTLNITEGEGIGYKNRSKAREQALKDIENVDKLDDIALFKFGGPYGITVEKYGGNIEAARQAIKNAIRQRNYLGNTNNYTEFANPGEINKTFLPMLSILDSNTLKTIAKSYNIENADNLASNEDLIDAISAQAQYDKNFKFSNNYIKMMNKRKKIVTMNAQSISNDELINLANSYGIPITDNNGNILPKATIVSNIQSMIKNSPRSSVKIRKLYKESIKSFNDKKKEYSGYINANDNDAIKLAIMDIDEEFVDLTPKEKLDRLIKIKVVKDKDDPLLADIYVDGITAEQQSAILDKIYLNHIVKHYAFGSDDAYKIGEAYVTAGEKRISKDGMIKTIAQSGKTFLNNEAIIPKENKSYQAKLNDAGHEAALATINGEKVADNPYVPNFGKGSSSRRRYRGQSSRRRQLASQRGQITNRQESENAEAVVAEATETASEAAATITASTEGTDSVTISGKRITAKDLIAQAKSHIGEMGAGGVVGGIASMLLGLVGGPLAGAAIGAGAALVHKSEFLQEKLFGKKVDGERQGGIVSKEIVDAAQKYAPDMFKYGLAGIIPSLITGLGPIPGILAGGAIGYLKNNEKFTNKYFGEHGKLTLGTKEKKIIQDMLPGAGKGAIGGLIGELVLGGMGIPTFGLLGSMLIGSGVGMMASTQDFKDMLLGVADSKGNREGGLLGIIKDTFNPILDATIQFKDKLLQTLEDNIVKPIADTIQPLIHELPRIFGVIPNMISKFLDTHFGRSLTGWLRDLTSPITGAITKLAMPITNGLLNLVTSPVKLLGVAGRGLRKKQIREHRADYMTAKDRIEFGLDNSMGMSNYDRALAAISKDGSNGGLSVEQATQLRNALEVVDMTKTNLTANKRKNQRNINNIIDSYTTKDGKKLSKSTRNDIRKALENNNSSEVIRILSTRSYKGENIGMSESEIQALLNDRGLKSEMEEYQRNKINEKYLGDKKFKDESQKKMDELLKQMGIDPDTIRDPKERARFIKNLTTEIEDREANDDKNMMEPIKRISDTAEDISKTIKDWFSFQRDIALGNNDAAKAKAEKFTKEMDEEIAKTTKRNNKNMIDIGNAAVRAKVRKFEEENGRELDLDNPEDLAEYNKIKATVFKSETDENGNITGFKEELSDDFKEFADKGTAVVGSTVDRAGRAVISSVDNAARTLGYLGADAAGGTFQFGGKILNAGTALAKAPVKLLTYVPGKFGTKMKKVYGAMENLQTLTDEVGEKGHEKLREGITRASGKVGDVFRDLDTRTANATKGLRFKSREMINDMDASAEFDEDYAAYYNIDHYINSGGDRDLVSVFDNRFIKFSKESFEYYKNIKDTKKVQWNNINNFLRNGTFIKFVRGRKLSNQYEITIEDLKVLLGESTKGDFRKLIQRIEEYLNGIKVSIFNEKKNKYITKKISYYFDDFGSFKNLINKKLKNGKNIGSSSDTTIEHLPVEEESNATNIQSENNINTEQSIENQEANQEQASAAFGTVPNYALGTVLSGLATAGKFIGETALNIGKGAAKLAWKGVKGATKLAWKGVKGLAKSAVNGITGLIPNSIKNIAGALTDKITDMASNVKNSIKDKAGKFQELINLGNGKLAIFKGKKDKDGNIKDIDADTTNADTREAMNQLEEEKKQQEEANKAQINTGNAFQEMINPSDNKASTAVNFIGTILKAIAIGGVVALLWEPIIKPIITKVWDGFVKPVGSWVLNTALPWFNDNILTPFMLKLPEIIYNGIHNINKIQVDSIGKTNTKSIDYQEYFTDEEKKIVQNNGSYTNSMISKTYLKQIESTIQEIGNSDITNNPDPKRKEDLANRVILYIKSAKQNGASDSDIINSLKKTKLHYEGDYNKIIPAIYNNDEVAINELKNALINVTDLNDPSKGDFKTQVHNTAVNSAITNSAIGGTAIGALGGGLVAGKIGAALGTTIAPGIGTAIGALLGLGIGALTGKVTGEIASSAGGYGALDDNDDKPLSKYGRYKESLNNKPNILNGLLGGIFLQNAQNDNMIDTSFNESSVLSTIEAAKEGRISIFSSEYWNNDSGNVLSNAYSKAMKIMAIPSIVIRNSMRYFLEDASEFTKQFSKLGSSNYVTSTDAFDPSAGAQFLNGTGKYGKGKYVKQIDPSVANIGFNTGIDSEYQTIGDSGCGPAAAVNAIQSMYGRSKSLINAAKFALKNGYKEKNGGTKPGFFKNYFASKGLKSQTTSNKNTLASNIRAGIPTVLMGQDKKGVSSSTPYGRNPHYVTATGVDSKGRVIIQDPESRYDNQLYSMDDVINKTSFGVSAYGRSKMDNIFSLFMNILNNSNAGKVFNSLLGNKYGKGKYDAEVWNYLKNNMGFTDAGAAGVIGNMNQESNVDPGNLSDSIKSISDEDFTKGVDNGSITKQQFITGDGTNFSHYNGDYGYGLVQWYAKDVKEWLYDYIKSKNLSIGDLTGQLEFLKYDTTDLRKSRYADMINTLKTTNDPSKAAASFLKIYEVSGEEPGDPGYDNRIKYAKEVYDKLKGTTGIAISDSETAISSEASDNSTSDYLNIFGMLKNVLNNSNAGKVFNSLLGINSDSSNSSSSTSTSSNNSSSSNTKKVNASSNKMINDVVSLALEQVGGGKTNGSSIKDNIYNDWWDNGFKDGAAPGSGNAWDWCAAFVSWVMRHAGVPETIVPNYRGCTSTGHDYIIKNYGAKAVNTKDTEPGDIMFFSDNNGSSFYHTGLVVNRKDTSTLDTVEGNTGNGDTVSNYTYNVTDSRLYPIRPNYGKGNNNDKPLSKYGRYKESLCDNCNSKNEYIEMKINEYKHDQLMQLESIKQKSKYGKGTNEIKDNTNLINTIITILYTIADNTDKLNMIVSILNDKLGIKIEPKDINSNVNRETLKQRIMKSLNNTPNLISATSKINGFADDADNSGVLSVINAMNIIASE